ncbi:MAG: hypothetical protein ACRD0Q_09915 [Acidimicrobiales bacterium]
MTVIVVCAVLVVVGLALAVVWGGNSVADPPGPDSAEPPDRPTAGLALSRLAWRLDIAIISGLVAGITIAGAGGRLAMRLLAATAGDGAQGRLTEAEEVVGRITTEGTIGFIVFVGVFSGLLTGVAVMVLRRWLPRGRLGGFAFGALLLVVGATRLEPMRTDNPDFDLVGPSWLALVVFGAVVLAQGVVTAAVASRLSRSLPLLSRRPVTIFAHLPIVVILLPSPLLVGAVVLAALAVSLTRFPRVAGLFESRRALVAGRVVLAALALVSLPGFVVAIADIAGRGP